MEESLSCEEFMDFDLRGIATLYTVSLSYREGGGMHRSTGNLRHLITMRAQMTACRLTIREGSWKSGHCGCRRCQDGHKQRWTIFRCLLGYIDIDELSWSKTASNHQGRQKHYLLLFENHMKFVRLELILL